MKRCTHTREALEASPQTPFISRNRWRLWAILWFSLGAEVGWRLLSFVLDCQRSEARPRVSNRDCPAPEPLLPSFLSKGYAKKQEGFFASGFSYLHVTRRSTLDRYVKKHPFPWLTKRHLLASFYIPAGLSLGTMQSSGVSGQGGGCIQLDGLFKKAPRISREMERTYRCGKRRDVLSGACLAARLITSF